MHYTQTENLSTLLFTYKVLEWKYMNDMMIWTSQLWPEQTASSDQVFRAVSSQAGTLHSISSVPEVVQYQSISSALQFI